MDFAAGFEVGISETPEPEHKIPFEIDWTTQKDTKDSARDMNNVDTIIIHATASKPEYLSVEQIHQMHILERGWVGIGYHFVIQPDGKIQAGRNVRKRGAHAKGWNYRSIGIAYVGGIDGKDTRTFAQKESMQNLVDYLCQQFPEIKNLMGHRDTGAKKACPCFDVAEELTLPAKHDYEI